MNTVVVSTHRRPFHTRLCIESLCRAQRWYPWVDMLSVCVSPNGDSKVEDEIRGVIDRNPDMPSPVNFIDMWYEPDEITSPNLASKWMLDKAFHLGADIVLYVEDDVIVSPDAFALLDYVKHWTEATVEDVKTGTITREKRVAGACLYHETIPEHYLTNPPDPRRLHLVNGLNTCGGTAFLREPYLTILAPQWNCKEVLPTGFDYSAHFLLYLHKMFMVYPDLSRSMNIGWSGGALSQEQWASHCGRSTWCQTSQALRDWRLFDVDREFPEPVREEWMKDELVHRGIA